MEFLIALIVALAIAYYAYVKGYNPIIWFFAAVPAGVISLASLLLLPWMNDPQITPAEHKRLALIGNIVGGVMIIVNVLIIIFINQLFLLYEAD